ncbi:MAG: hypothetical protein INR64_07015 [Caulobacteraceae bacterium]|nr:hypothetical protein [Caulobacter sp.]
MRVSLMARRAALVLSLAAMAACAGAPSPPPAPPVATAANPQPACPRLFVSPSGEPFRREPGGACPLAVWFAAADANHDGALSRSEFKADAARFFAKLDLNGDGVLEPEEVQHYEQVVVPEILGRSREARLEPRLVLAQFGGAGGGGMGGMGGGHGGGGGRRHQAGSGETHHDAGPGASPDGLSRYSLLDEPEPVASADLDFNGRITAEEFLTLASQRFDALDTTGSGALTLPALQARMAARSGERRRPGSPGGGRRRQGA